MKRTPLRRGTSELRRKTRLESRTPIRSGSFLRRKRRDGTLHRLGHKDLQPVFRAYIYRRDGYRCVTCGKTCTDDNRQPGHLFKSSLCGYALRYHPWAVNVQCAYCNGPGDGEQALYAERAKEKWGEDAYRAMLELYRDGKRGRTFKINWKEAIEYYKDPPIAHALILPFVTDVTVVK